MTTQEFQSALAKANTVEEIAKLRIEVGAPKYVSECKQKISKVCKEQGWTVAELSMSALKKWTSNTDCGNLSKIIVPEKSRALPQFKGKEVTLYILHKEGRSFQTVEILVK